MKQHYIFSVTENAEFKPINVPHCREAFQVLLEMAHDFIKDGHRVAIHSSRDGLVFDSKEISA